METKTTNVNTALQMGERGEVSCLPHAPFPGTETWHH